MRRPASPEEDAMVVATSGRTRFGALLVAGTLLTGSSSSAQVVATNFEELRVKVVQGDEIYVTDTSGKESRVSVVEVGTSLIVEMSGTRRELSEADVRQIRQRQPDSLWTGAIVGFGVGAAFGVVPVSLMSPSCQGAECVVPIIAGGAAGAGIGIGIDALIKGRKVIYTAGGRQASQLRVVPLISASARGASLSVRF
jgi:hypothetical protein